MIKVYQTIVDKGKGNCAQAAIASLLELDLMDVPNFIMHENRGYEYTIFGFLRSRGYDVTYIDKGKNSTEFLKKVAKFDNGLNGYFYASVNSQTFEDTTHAVIVDSDLNIVHDPNPNQLALNLTPNDILSIIAMHDMIIGKTGKLFTLQDWQEAGDEEKNLNTYR